jgi:glycerophosphoryl diester phosphodiesterase
MTRTPLPPALLRLPITHRALHDRNKGRIENSPSAIQAALDAGYAIEIDVQMSADGEAIVFHDEELARLTGRPGWIKDHTAAELAKITLIDSTDTIHTLPQILGMIAGRVPLLIEIKDQTQTLSETDGSLEAAVAAALRGYEGDVAVMSFNPHSVAHMARLAPEIARGLTTSSYNYADWPTVPAATCDSLRGIPDYDRTQSSFISHQGNDLDRARVAALKAQGAAILCWTIKSPEQEAMARKIADNVTFERYSAAIPA